MTVLRSISPTSPPPLSFVDRPTVVQVVKLPGLVVDHICGCIASKPYYIDIDIATRIGPLPLHPVAPTVGCNCPESSRCVRRSVVRSLRAAQSAKKGPGVSDLSGCTLTHESSLLPARCA